MLTRRATTAGLAATFLGPPLRAAAQGIAGTGDLTARPQRQRLRADGSPAEVWALNDRLARVLRAQHGSRWTARLHNNTALPLSLHIHGLRGPNAMDGVGGLTQSPIPPGGTFDYRLTPPDAGTYLLRPCVLGNSAQPSERGLSGLLIVEEQNPPSVDRDDAILIDDWLLSEDGSLAPFDSEPTGRLGNWLSVNGQAIPLKIEARPGGRVRLRLANACNARIMRLRFDRLKPFVIAIDGQPTDTFEPLRSSLPFAPGSRYDIIVDVPDEIGATGTVVAAIGDGIALVELVARGKKDSARPAIGPMPPNPNLPATIKLQNATRRDLVIRAGAAGALSPWTLNGAAGDVAVPLMKVKRGTPVVLALDNQTDFVQPMHLHGHAFRLLHGLDDGWEPYFLDTLQVPERRIARIAFVADNPGKWLLASTVMERFDAGLWTWIEVS